MKTELFNLTLAFRGLSDEDEEEAGVEDPGTLDDEDEDADEAGESLGGEMEAADEGEATLEG